MCNKNEHCSWSSFLVAERTLQLYFAKTVFKNPVQFLCNGLRKCNIGPWNNFNYSVVQKYFLQWKINRLGCLLQLQFCLCHTTCPVCCAEISPDSCPGGELCRYQPKHWFRLNTFLYISLNIISLFSVCFRSCMLFFFFFWQIICIVYFHSPYLTNINISMNRGKTILKKQTKIQKEKLHHLLVF